MTGGFGEDRLADALNLQEGCWDQDRARVDRIRQVDGASPRSHERFRDGGKAEASQQAPPTPAAPSRLQTMGSGLFPGAWCASISGGAVDHRRPMRATAPAQQRHPPAVPPSSVRPVQPLHRPAKPHRAEQSAHLEYRRHDANLCSQIALVQPDNR